MKVKCLKILTTGPKREDLGEKTDHLTIGKEYIVYIDNFFTSLKLLSILQDYDIRAAGTVRTSRTKREENEEKR